MVGFAQLLAENLAGDRDRQVGRARPDFHQGLILGVGDLLLRSLAGRFGLGLGLLLGLLKDRGGSGLGFLDQGSDLVGGLGQFLAMLRGQGLGIVPSFLGVEQDLL